MNTPGAKTNLERAAQSPDPVIRAVAARRKEIIAEAEKLDGFLSMYADLPVSGTSNVVNFRPPNSVLNTPSPRLMGDFLAMARATLRDANKPLQLRYFYKAFWERVPELTPIKLDSFRQRLTQLRDDIELLSDKQGYWLKGVPVPNETLPQKQAADA